MAEFKVIHKALVQILCLPHLCTNASERAEFDVTSVTVSCFDKEGIAFRVVVGFQPF